MYMPAESTFDIVSEFDRQELVNAVDQTQREARTRYDLKDSKIELVLGEKELTIVADSEMHVAAVRDVLQTKALRRNLSLKIFKYGPVEEIGGMRVRQVIALQQGIPEDVAKKLQKLIRDQFPKVQPRIQGEALRIGSKSKDELQGVIKLLKERQDDFTVPLQFTNYR
jgi:cyclic-di-GMP-binding protein